MLYLFGRLALSDSFYFNQDIEPDERPEVQPARQQPTLPERAPRPAAGGPQPRLGGFQHLAGPPSVESAA